jgi:hypothetical protein
MLAAFSVAIVFLVRRFQAEGEPLDWGRLENRFLLAGALVVVGCFFAGENIGYRSVFLLLTLPALLPLRRAVTGGTLRAVLPLTIAAVVFLLWEETIRRRFTSGLRDLGLEAVLVGKAGALFWVGRELVWWCVVSVLAAMISLFVLQCPSVREIARAFRPAIRLEIRP